MRMWWLIGMIAACGPSVATQDGDGSEGESTGDATTSTSTTSTTSTTTSVDESSSTGVTPSVPGRCITTIAIDVEPSTYLDAGRLGSEGPMQLIFVDYEQDRALVVGAPAIDGPWTVVQTIDGRTPSEVVDIDGDARDDVVMHVGTDATWWRPDADGVLDQVGPIVDEQDSDTFLHLPDDPRAARAHAELDLEVMLGSGDGTFSPPTITSSPDMDYSPGPPVVAHGEGLLQVERFAIECIGFCSDGSWIFRVESNGTAALLATTDPQDNVLALADLEHDGDLDVFAWRDSAVEVRRGPAFDEREALVTATGGRIGDLDADGFVDVVVTDGDAMLVYWNDAGVLVDEPTYVQLEGYPVQLSGKPVDLDDDGADEVVVGYGVAGDQAIVRTVACE